MPKPELRMAIDYNRGHVLPVRWSLIASAWLRETIIRPTSRTPMRRALVWPMVFVFIGWWVVHPWDGPLSAWIQAMAQRLSGDLRRELFAWQQFGQGFAIALTVLLVMRLEPSRWRRLLDFALACAIAQSVSTAGKLLIGRPRPRPYFEDPTTLLGPWGVYPIPGKDGMQRLVHAWDIAGGATTDLWSMPSSHTMFAMVLAVFVSRLYPRISPIMYGLAILVGLGRVMFDAHWPTDVVVGGALGYAIGQGVISQYAGVRLLDWVWRVLVNRESQPALTTVQQADRTSFLGRARSEG